MTIELTEEQVAAILVRERGRKCRRARTRIQMPEQIEDELRHMGELDKEHYVVLTLDSSGGVIGRHVVSVGIVDAALVHPRETFRVAILDNATKIIVAHNHPSGNAEPSDEDQLITKRLLAAGKILGIPVLDHVVVGVGSCVSFRDRGWIV